MTTYIETRVNPRFKTIEIVSAVWAGDKPGIGHQPIYLKFKGEVFPKANDKITYDWINGAYLIVDDIWGDMVKAMVFTTDPETSWFPLSKVVPGTVFYILED